MKALLRNSFPKAPSLLVVAASLAITASAVAADPPAKAAAEKNQCVGCHEVEELSISLGHSMSEWRASAHGRAGVTCEKCHGGNAAAAEAAEAHRGVLASSEPDSRVSQRNLAATCGSCHDKQLEAYKSTVHAKEVNEEGDAATCLTCHGSMATSYPSPRELSSRCTVCHDKPVEARSALAWLSTAKTQLLRTRRSLQSAKTVVPEWEADAEKRFHEMEAEWAKIELQWHRFDMEASIKHSREVLGLAKLLDEEAQLKIKIAQGGEEPKAKLKKGD